MVGEAGERAGRGAGRAAGAQQGDSRWLFARDDGWRLVIDRGRRGAGDHVFSSAESRGA